MSISDSEDLDSKPSASAQPRPTETPPRRQKRGLNNKTNDPNNGATGNNNNNNNNDGDGSAAVVQNMTLTSEQQMELSYQCTASLLRGANNTNNNNGGGGKEILVMPSLVSLSDAFFKINDNNNHDGYHDGTDIISSDHRSAILPDLPANNNNINNDNNGVASADTVSAAPRLRPRLNLNLPADNNTSNTNTSSSSDIDMSMGMGNTHNFNSSSNVNSGMMSQQQLVRPPREREDWPIGPQGAQVPSYLLEIEMEMERVSNNNYSSGNGNHHQQQQQLAHELYSAEGDANTLPAVAAAAAGGRNLLDSPQRSAARRVREIMTRQQQQQQQPPVHYINAAQSLEHAAQRLEETLRQRDVDGHDLSHRGLPGSGAYSISSPGGGGGGGRKKKQKMKKKNPSMEDLEVETLTHLAEIMLHPPTEVVNGRYCWEGEEAKVEASGEVEQDGGQNNVMMTSPLQHGNNEKMEIGVDNINEGGGDSFRKDDDIYHDDEMMPDDDKTTKPPSHSLSLPPITSLLNKQSRYPTLNAAETSISTLGKSCPTRRVCQHPFRRNDIVWVCRTCQSDETCVLCHDCFSNSNHEGHDVAFYHAQAGGCCDCGDADAWDPKGFCKKHGGHNGQGAPPGTEVAKAEPAVLGSIHACADWLVDVVQSGVEGGYRRANPLHLSSAEGKKSSSTGITRTDSALQESYEEPEFGRDRQREQNVRRERSLTRRNTVADMETTASNAEDDISRASNSMQASNSMMSFEAIFSEAASTDFDGSGNGVESRVSTPIIHEVQFDPTAASNSRRRSESNATTNSSKRDADSSIDDNVFCPTAASTSKSSSSHRRATKKARAPPKSPARALGDLGRDGCGLFLVIHSDDIRIGAHSSTEATNALKEFFSKSVSADAGGAVTSGWDALGGSGGGFYFSGNAGPFPRVDQDGRVNRPNIRIVPRISRFRSSNLDSIVEKILRIIKKRGELIVWGTQELLAECGDVTGRCWRDGDSNSSSLIGAAMLNRAKLLTDGGLVCSIKTRKEVVNEQTATSVIKLINLVAQSCDPLCDQVSSGISGRGITSTLSPLLRNDLKLPYKLVSSWHALLLTLLAVPNFKASLANAYCDTYRAVTGEYARGVGLIERSSYTLSVQFLNRISYVTELVRERSLITNLFLCLYEILSLATSSKVSPPIMKDFDTAGTSNLIAAIMVLMGHASMVGADEESLFHAFDAELNDIMNRSGGDSRHHGRVSTRGLRREHHRNLIERSAMLNPKLDPTHNALAHRRYSVCISDLKCVLNVEGMARHFASVPCKGGDDVPSALNAWIKTLSLAQNMDGQCWKDYSQAHVERENSAWVGAFNTSISLGSLYERLLKWEDSDPSPIDNCVKLLSCAELCYYTLTKGVDRWQRGEMLSCRPTPAPSSMKVDHALKSASLPFSTVASAHGTPLAMIALPLSQLEPFSFHLPLHRFAAACAREVSRRTDDNGGLLELIDKFRVNPNDPDKEREKQVRKNDLLFRGMMEFPIIVLSRAAQIRASIWKRNGPGMSDMVLNYSEPPFCRNLQDADIFLVQLALVCMANLTENEDEMGNGCLHSFNSAGTARLVNLLIHRFGVFDFLGFEMAPPTDFDRYFGEIRSGMYPAEIKPIVKVAENCSVSSTPAMPWTYTPARDSSHEMFLLGELLHFFITLITELPPPPAADESQHAIEARGRLMREVIHRLASSAKTHSEMTEVSHILSNRDTDVLCELGKKINPDDASAAALEEALNEVGTRKCKSGVPDEWELKESAWSEYDPSFQHISTRAHQQASENRPKQKAGAPYLPYAPRPLPSHNLFNRLRRDLTSDSTLLACIYRVLHVHCRQPSVVLKDYPGRSMYKANASETVLARAIHLLTLGVYAWDEDASIGSTDSANWKSQGGGGVASVFVNFDRRPTASDWVENVLLRSPYEIMQHKEYNDDEGSEQNILWLLGQVALETQTREDDMSGFLGGLDRSLKSGAMFICNFAAKVSSEASAIVTRHFKNNSAKGSADNLAKRKNAAKEKALAAMKAQMAKFAANLGGDDEDDPMSDAEGDKTSTRDDSMLATPVRQRADSTGLEAMDLSPHGDFLLTPTIHPSTPFTPRTPQTPFFPGVDGPIESESSARLFAEVPRCIICGADDKIDCNDDADSSTMLQQKEKRTLAFCGFAQASRVIQGGSGDPTVLLDEEKKTWRHVGVHTALCGHAIHKSCCETYIKTSQRDRQADRLEGGKRREFRCPLCQRLSNCLVPFVDVATDWLDSPISTSKGEALPSTAADDGMAIDGLSYNDSYKSMPLHDFLSNSEWWATKNDGYVWDGRCNFSPATYSEEKKVSSSANVAGDGTRTKKNLQGKKELIKAWNNVLRTPRRLQRRSRPSGFVLIPPGATEQKDTNNSDILRKLMDQIVDVGQRADLKRVGEEELTKDYGEFRHYLTERTIYNKRYRATGRDALDWPLCLTSRSMSEARRQELSKEKMISKLLYTIQAFTYSCCSESSDCRRLLRSESVDTSSIYSKFGVGKSVMKNNLLLLPQAESSVDGGFQPFDGRLGKTRYMALSLMAAASPVAKEIVQLCIPFPSSSESSPSVFDFDADDDIKSVKRAPIAYPLLCSHILTHTTGALIAVTGSARVEERNCSTDQVVDDCRKFISLGLIARIVQVLLTGLMYWTAEQIDVVLRLMREEMIDDMKHEEYRWGQSCLDLLLIIFGRESEEAFLDTTNSDANLIKSQILKGIDAAKGAAVSFLLDVAVIVQILVPNIFSDTAMHPDSCGSSDLDAMKRLMELIRMESIQDIIQSDLVQLVIKSWYIKATEKDSSQLQSPPHINYETWPVARGELRDQHSTANDEVPPHCTPLLGYPSRTSHTDSDSCRITCLPKSYTDLYAQLSALCPDNDQIALCLICGSVLDAGGKGECTKHALKCGAGGGVFFLVQECVGLIMHGTKAAYVPSIFVDSHGETPQYRGRPLNLDPRRWSLLQDMWCSHSVREKVISERSTTRQVIIPNYY